MLTSDDIIVNEIAPPTHQGNYSIEACDFSQFDTPYLGVLGAPLPANSICMHQLLCSMSLASMLEAAENTTENPSAHLHMYGKIGSEAHRKMGHVTFVYDAG